MYYTVIHVSYCTELTERVEYGDCNLGQWVAFVELHDSNNSNNNNNNHDNHNNNNNNNNNNSSNHDTTTTTTTNKQITVDLGQRLAGLELHGQRDLGARRGGELVAQGRDGHLVLACM